MVHVGVLSDGTLPVVRAEVLLMIAAPPPAIVTFVRRMMEARQGMKRKREPREGGALVDEKEPLPLPPPAAHPGLSTALKPVSPPLPPQKDILSLPDRDHLRAVVRDFDHLEFGE